MKPGSFLGQNTNQYYHHHKRRSIIISLRWIPFFTSCFLITTTTPYSLSLKPDPHNHHPNVLDNTLDYSSTTTTTSKSQVSPDLTISIDNNKNKNGKSDNNGDDDDDDDDMFTEEDKKFQERVQSSLMTVQNWDADIELIQECRAQTPWEDLRNATGPYSRPDQDRLLQGNENALFLQRLCRWFKEALMNWVNAPPCQVCGCKECEMKTVRGPETTEEHEGQAKRVEVYYCPECKANTTTFPRYNRAKKLLETKKGRCGEYSNLFGLFCKSAGLETRLVLDLSDHLWTEVRLGDDSWIMADSCEGIIDKQSMYEYGWGKDGLCYMIAISSDHVVDVTPRYTRKYMTEDFQNRRRQHTSSEAASAKMIQQLNEKLQQNLSKSRLQELKRRQKIEEAELNWCKQSTEWTAQEKYGRGRISGSQTWKQARSEAGKKTKVNGDQTATTNNDDDDDNNSSGNERQVAGFEVEALLPPLVTTSDNVVVSLQVRPHPASRHDGIIVADTPCAIGEADSVSVVVVDNTTENKSFGCILLSKSFLTWQEVAEFVERLPSHRIIILNGKCKPSTENNNIDDDAMDEDVIKSVDSLSSRLGGWIRGKFIVKHGVTFIGQVDAHPDWTFCKTLEECPKEGHEVELQASTKTTDGDMTDGEPKKEEEQPMLRLRTEREVLPQCVAGRLPESCMPLKTQLLATEEQKRIAFTNFCNPAQEGQQQQQAQRYCGYTTKPNAPVYLINSSSYPFQKLAIHNECLKEENKWNTFHYLPSPLVPKDDHGIQTQSATAKKELPKFDVPLEINFFQHSLGTQLLDSNMTRLPTATSLHNTRLIGLYFSAHWCGPCRQFTPMLSEMYEVLKEYRPTHGFEIVFVSGDRDAQSFEQYFRTMPWQAIPFDHLQYVKQALNVTYGVRGIPSLVVLDAITGQVVVPADESRQAVSMACRGGEQGIESMLDSWLAQTPPESQEILSMLELSYQEQAKGNNKNDNGNNNEKENPYLMGDKKEPKRSDPAARIKEFFEKLVSEGSDPNSAAAKAIGLVSEEQNKPPTLDPGPLNGKATRTGLPIPNDALDVAFSRCIEWNSSGAVCEVLSTASKYLKNAAKEPWSPKFRTFRLSNKVADQITRVEGGIPLLQAVGFDVFGTAEDFKATIPVGADLDAMEKTISGLLEALQE